MRLLLLLLASLAHAAITNVRVEPGMADAIIRYTAPSASACTVQVWDMNLQSDASGPKATTQIATTSGSGATVTVTTVLAHGLREGRTWQVYLVDTGVPEWDGPKTVTVTGTKTFTFADGNAGSSTGGNMGQLVHDVNTDLFPNSNLDSRATSNNSGRYREFTAGKRIVEVADGTLNAYSRALQVNARHLYRITCGGDVANGEFRTTNIPLGYMAVDYPRPVVGGGKLAPDFTRQARWDKSDGIFLDRAIDPVTGVLYTPIYPPELIVDTAFTLSTTNTDVPTVAANWVNPGDARTQDGSNASYADATKDILCVKPIAIASSNGPSKPHWWTQNVSLENILVTVRAMGAAATQDDRDLEIALSTDSCNTAATEWQTISPTGSLSNLVFPSSPQGGFGDWHSATQRRLTNMDVQSKKSLLNASGTALTWQPDTTFGSSGPGLSFFDVSWPAGTKIRIGGGSSPCQSGTEYTIASVENNRAATIVEDAGTLTNQQWCVAPFGIMVRKKSTSTDQVDVDYITFTQRETRVPNENDSGSAKRCSETPISDADGNVGYICFSQGASGTTKIIHWVSKDNAESRFIMGHLVNLPGITGEFSGGNCNEVENTFSSSAPDTFYCMMSKTGGGGQVIAAYKIWWDGSGAWKGTSASSSPLTTCTTTTPISPNPCLQPINLSGTTYSVADLLADRNPEFDALKFGGCGLRSVQSHLLYGVCQRGPQDTVAWWFYYDTDKPIGSYDPMDQSTNPIIAAIPTWDTGFRGISGYHTGFGLSGSAQYGVIDTKFTRKNSATDSNGAGPFRMPIVSDAALNNTTDISACPDNQWNYTNCSTIHVTSEPYDPDPGSGDAGTPGEFGVATVGSGVRFWRCNEAASAYVRETITENVSNTGCQTYANDETGRILSKSGTAPDITLVVSRGTNASGAKSHAAGWSLFSWPMADNEAWAVDLNIVWDFQNCPTGGSLTCVNYASASTSHGSLTKYAMVGYTVASGLAQVAWPDPTPASIKATPTVNLNLPFHVWPVFSGKFGWRFSGPTQRYNSNNHTDFAESRKTAYQWFVDSRPDLYGTIGPEYHWQFAKVSGSTYLYQYDSQLQGDRRLPWSKHLPFVIQSDRRTMLDKSGPSSVLADNSGDHYYKCVSWKADECVTGSKPGDIFVNLPYATLGSWTKYSCGGYGWSEQEICASPIDPVSGPNVQFWFGGADGKMGRGRHMRKLGWGAHSSWKLSGQVPGVFPNGEWLGPLWVNFLNEHRTGMGLMMKLPPIPPEDGYDRTTFLPVSLSSGSAPAGTAVAQVEYGYAFYGTPVQKYCTERRESCLATGSSVIGTLPITNPWSTANTNGSWQYGSTTVTAGTPITLTFSAAHKLTDDIRVRASTATTSKNTWTWPINITGANTLELVGSTTGDVNTGSQTAMVEKVEAPFAFSGESVAVAGATNASPIEITTTARHPFQTGSNVCVASVGGNTAANGCYQITATGPSAFTLDGSTGNGSYTSGGTVTPGGVSCSSGCTVVVPALSRHVMYYRWRYLDSTGAVIATGATQSMVTP